MKSKILENAKELGLTDNSITVLMERYLKKGSDGQFIELPRDMFRRVAKVISKGDAAFEELSYNMMVKGIFLPNSPTLMNAGRRMGLLSACFVLPIEDSVDGIFDTVRNTAQVLKAGGGVGFTLDHLRPTGDWIASCDSTTSGPIPFWNVLNETINAIQQGAKRRGAAMMMMSIDHPDIIKFIFSKQDKTRFTNFNISVKIPDAWIEAFRKDPNQPHIVENYRGKKKFMIPRDILVSRYCLKDLIPADSTPTVPVWSMQDIWNVIVSNAWETGEPGVIFIDCVNRLNPTPNMGEIEASNPCGEQMLLPYESCNLGSVNLGYFVKPDKTYDWDGLREAVRFGVRFLNNVIDVNDYVIPEIKKISTENRKIGLGVMGFADTLFKLGISYGSPEGVACGDKFMEFVNIESHNESERMAQELGTFKNWKGSRWDTELHRQQYNAACTTVAPTGTISIISNCSCGIEPLFSLAFYRNVLEGKRLLEVHSAFKKVAESNSYWGYAESELYEKITTEGSIQHIPNIPDEIKKIFVCAHDVSPEFHIKMQAAFQKHCDSSISKTINFPNVAKVEDVSKIYAMAFDMGCKGITIYRDGCRPNQPMELGNKKEGEIIVVHNAPKRPKELDGVVHVIKPNGKKYTIFVGLLAGRVYEVFALDGKLARIEDGMKGKIIKNVDDQGKNIYSFEEGIMTIKQLNKHEDDEASIITRLISTSLRHGTPLEFLINQISKSKAVLSSLPKAIARALALYVKEEETKGKFKCPKCGSTNVKHNGFCWTCMQCLEGGCA